VSSLIDNTSHRVPSSNIRNFDLLSAAHKNCPSAQCATAANSIRNDVGSIFSEKMVLWNRFCAGNNLHFSYGFNYLAELRLNLNSISKFLLIFVLRFSYMCLFV